MYMMSSRVSFMSASSSSTALLSWRKNTNGKMVTSSSSSSSKNATTKPAGGERNKKSLRGISRALPADVQAFIDSLPDEKVNTFPRGAEAGWKVHKFGGTCVGSSERISGVCDLLIDGAKRGNQTFAVVSAMGVITKSEPKVTDCLINATTMAAARSREYVCRSGERQAAQCRRVFAVWPCVGHAHLACVDRRARERREAKRTVVL